mmetsp:Transcript_90186/g.229370  ORF Transcript_90186/g.229370 Transcript_90186/m.229370 type:complete len:219 (+) Transcript_90186:962-1618(+)
MFFSDCQCPGLLPWQERLPQRCLPRHRLCQFRRHARRRQAQITFRWRSSRPRKVHTVWLRQSAEGHQQPEEEQCGPGPGAALRGPGGRQWRQRVPGHVGRSLELGSTFARGLRRTGLRGALCQRLLNLGPGESTAGDRQDLPLLRRARGAQERVAEQVRRRERGDRGHPREAYGGGQQPASRGRGCCHRVRHVLGSALSGGGRPDKQGHHVAHFRKMG